MTRSTLRALGPRARRRLLLRAVLHPLLVVTALVVAYYLLPMDRPLGAVTGIVLFGALLCLTGLGVWQVRMILRSDYPAVRAIEALATSVPLFLLLFASTYYLMAHSATPMFSQPLTRTDALYFTVTVFSTVGFGDIVPKTEVARVVTMIQMLGDLLLLGVLLRAVLGAVRVGQQRKAAPDGAEHRSP